MISMDCEKMIYKAQAEEETYAEADANAEANATICDSIWG